MPNPVAIAALERAATNLRATNAILQILDAPDFNPAATDFKAHHSAMMQQVKAESSDVVATLDALKVGVAQPPLSGSILPTSGILDGSETSIKHDLKLLDDVQDADLPDSAAVNNFQALTTRIKKLAASVASAASR